MREPGPNDARTPELRSHISLRSLHSGLGSKLSEFQIQYLNAWGTEHAEMCRLATRCCEAYEWRCDLSEDPRQPWRSKPGSKTFTAIRREEIDAYFCRALALGFEGEIHKWRQFVYGTRPKGT